MKMDEMGQGSDTAVSASLQRPVSAVSTLFECAIFCLILL